MHSPFDTLRKKNPYRRERDPPWVGVINPARGGSTLGRTPSPRPAVGRNLIRIPFIGVLATRLDGFSRYFRKAEQPGFSVR